MTSPKNQGQQGSRGSGRRRRGGRGGRRRDVPQTPMADPAAIAKLERPFEEADFIVFDIETTGGNPEKNGITEIFAIRWGQGEVKGTFYSMVNPGVPIPPIVRRMTGINNQMVRGAPKIEEVMPGFVEFIKDDVLVSHNTIGDMKFIRYFGKVGANVDISNFFLCTHLLVEKLAPESPDKSLKGLAEHFKLARGELHRAEGDAYVTLELFKVLLGKLKERRVKRIDEGVRLQGDFESGMRLGWGVKKSSLVKLPSGPGVIRLLDHDGKLLFLCSATHVDREVERLSSFQQLPRPLLKLVLRSYDVKADKTADAFAAMMAECDAVSRERMAVSPTVWHQKTIQTLFVVGTGDEMRFSVGAIEVGTARAFGPVRDRRLAIELLEKLGEAFGAKVNRDELVVTREQGELLTQYFDGTLAQGHAEVAKRARSVGMWFKPKERKVIKTRATTMMKLLQVQNRLKLGALLERSGALIIDSDGGPKAYPIAAARPHPGVAGDPDKLPSGAFADKLASTIKGHLASVHGKPISAQDVHHVNAALWWLCNNRPDGKYWTLAELEGQNSGLAK